MTPFLLAATLAVLAAPAAEPPKPLALHPDNPRYFLFRGKPAVTKCADCGASICSDCRSWSRQDISSCATNSSVG